MNEINSETLMKYAEKYGIKGRRTLSILGKNQQLINAMSSQIGIEFLRWLISRVESNRIKYDKMDIDSSNAKFIEARARYNEAEELLFGFLDVLDTHESLLNQIKEGMKK